MKKLLFLLVFSTYALAYPTVLVPVDWKDVPEVPPAVRNLNSPYLGECVCDVTWGICDPHCCCDDDCDAATISSFSYCLPERFSSPYLDYCFPKDRATSLKRINNIDATYIDKKRQGYSAVCVIRSNHPKELYRYFSVPTTVQKPNILTPSAPVVPPNQVYTVGSPLVFAKQVPIGGKASYRRADGFQLPYTGDDGSCAPFGRTVAFLDPIKGVSCVLNGAQICSEFATEKYTNLFVQSIQGYRGLDLAFIPVTLRILKASKVLVDTAVSSGTDVESAFLSRADSTTCYNAILAVTAQFTYASNATGTIIAAVINVAVEDIKLDQYTAVTFEVGFVAENSTIPKNIVAGTPGYLPGYKVRAGILVNENGKSAILELQSGFAVPSGGRACDVRHWKSSSFLYSVLSSGCIVSMDEARVQSMCSTGTADLIRNLINAPVGSVGKALDRIAITNDALTNDTSSWIAIDGLSDALSSKSGTYNEYDRACERVMVGLHYQFVVARAGAEYNPQDIIVGAFVSPILGTLKIRDQTTFDSSATSPQQITFKVTFSRYNPHSQATIMRRVVAPPILPRLDNTIFYPFRRPYPL
ncbi:hypothetical protein ABL78_5258 [Leptomonas seymouri]|uniref:Tectonic-1-3 N-terminal domain-containing protein n=1 Tax=Leptomonas seymouri TaxID=5684 RepID=A0A0N1I2E7_LEPSE|nr:hypothetical protein ABL78_5258 [Leptomonas seymouri]|eukprot:KPI85678.1 hypothetical protein ABL78_5258 [Leptomonas seymouri]